MKRFLLFLSISTNLFFLVTTAAAQIGQTVNSGSATTPINFPGVGCVYSWVNTMPGIGLAAGGTGNIASFIAVNNSSSPVTAIITGLPVNMGTNCNGTLITYSITVNPAAATPPAITAGPATGIISACAGTASASPDIQQFIVSATGLNGNITVTAPDNFQVSLSPVPTGNSGYGDTVTLIAPGGAVDSMIVYVRSSPAALPGNISGNVTLTSPGMVNSKVPVTGMVNVPPTVNAVPNQTVNNGSLTTPISFTGTANTFTWVNDTPGINLGTSGTGNIASFTAINTGSSTVTAHVTVTPLSFGYAYIANSISNTVSVINTANNLVVTTIPVGQDPTGLSVSPDGSRVYVANQRSNSVSVISTSTNTVLSTISIIGQSPTTVSVSPDGTRIYVVNLNSNNVSVINTANNTLIATIGVGGYPVCSAVSRDGSTVYVVNSSNSISVINTASNTIKATIPVNNSPYGIAVSPDGSTLYVSVLAASNVAVISTATYAITATIPVASSPAGIAISPDGTKVYVSNGGSNSVSVISTASNSVVAAIAAGSNPAGISISPDGGLVYVANEQSNTVSVISTATNMVTATVDVGEYPLSLGSFVTGGTGCSGTPVTFTIMVNPSAVLPQIIPPGSYSFLTSVYGTPSVAEELPVSGTNLTAGILVTAPPGFEVSTDNINFNVSVTAGGAGDIDDAPVYIRLASTTPVGVYNEKVTLSSPGAGDIVFEFPTSTVTPAPLTITADGKNKVYGMPNPVLTATYNGFVNNEGPANLTTPPIISTTAINSSPPGLYPIMVSGAASPNYDFTYVNGILRIVADTSVIVIPNAFTPNGDGINDTWNVKFLDSYPNCTVKIYNRYGENVYSSVGYGIAWNGTYRGVQLPEGTYYYIINLGNGTKVLAGSITIIR